MKRNGLITVACLALLPLPSSAQPGCRDCQPAPQPPPARAVAPPQTQSADDFEMFLENILESPRGQKTAAPGANRPTPPYVAACPVCSCCRVAAAAEIKPPIPPAPAVQWRTDYGKARDEAKDKARALVLVFRTTPCGWCDKLDAALRDDAEAAKLLNECVVPVELSGPDNLALATALRIEAYPTVVVAAADGKILLRLNGYRDAATLKKEIQAGLDKPATGP